MMPPEGVPDSLEEEIEQPAVREATPEERPNAAHTSGPTETMLDGGFLGLGGAGQWV
jgi:hypothetical protein